MTNKLQNRDGLPDAFLEEKRFFELYGPGKTDTPSGWNTPENWKYLEDIPEDKYFGFAIGNNSSYLMIDCDHVIDDSGHIIPWVKDALGRATEYSKTYWELSKSGKGFHLFCDLGDLAESFLPVSNSYDQIIIDMAPEEYKALTKEERDKVPKIELFYKTTGRYVYLTGKHKNFYQVAKDEAAAGIFRELLSIREEYHAKYNNNDDCFTMEWMGGKVDLRRVIEREDSEWKAIHKAFYQWEPERRLTNDQKKELESKLESDSLEYYDSEIDFFRHLDLVENDSENLTEYGKKILRAYKAVTERTSRHFITDEDRRRVLEALPHISAECSGEVWHHVACALANSGFSFEVFDEWSKYGGQIDSNGKYKKTAVCSKYERDRTVKQWASASRAGAPNWNYKTIFTLAHNAGWEEVREYPLPPKAAENQEPQIELGPFEVPTMRELYEQEIPPLEWIVEDILPTGVFLVGSPPKYYKSFMALDLCLTVCVGGRFLGFQTLKHDCLYLDLESGNRRPRDRAKIILKGELPPENFRVVTRDTFWIRDETRKSKRKRPMLGDGFREYLEAILKKYPEIKLVVIDVFKKIRLPAKKGQDGYDRDYEDLTELGEIAEQFKICILVIHHTRKMKDPSDPFNELSGSTGLTGSVDGSWVIAKKNRNDPDAVLYTTGRDIDSKELSVKFDRQLMRWTSPGTLEDVELQQSRKEYDNSPIIKTIKKLLNQNGGEWEGSATDIQAACKYFGFFVVEDAARIGKRFQEWEMFIHFDGITVEYARSGKSRKYIFKNQ